MLGYRYHTSNKGEIKKNIFNDILYVLYLGHFTPKWKLFTKLLKHIRPLQFKIKGTKFSSENIS